MAYRRKKGKPTQKVPPDVEELTSAQEMIYFVEALAQFKLNKHEKLSWRVSTPSSFVNGLSGEEGQLRFVDNVDSLCINRLNEREEMPHLLIGWLTLEGNLAGISNIIDSGDVLEATLRWSLDGTQWFCVWVQLHEVEAQVVLSSLVTLQPSIDQDAVHELVSYCRRGIVQMIAQRPLEGGRCLQLRVGVFASRKVINMGGADSLPLARTHSIGGEIVKAFQQQSVVSTNEVQSLPDGLIGTSKTSGSMKDRILQFYQWVCSHQERVLPTNPPLLPAEVPGLTADLLQYQIKAIQWMLAREQADEWAAAAAGDDWNQDQLHPLWEEISMEGLPPLYYNCYTGRLSLERYPPPFSPKGGILADEMGLGKTVEMLTLILINKWSVGCDNSSSRSLVENYRNGTPREERAGEKMEEDIGGASKQRVTSGGEIVRSDLEAGLEEDAPKMGQEEEEEESMVNGDDAVLNPCEDEPRQKETFDDEEVSVMRVDMAKNGKDWQFVGEEMELNKEGGSVNKAEGKGETLVNGSVGEGGDDDDVWCLCGASSIDDTDGLFVQCEMCHIWQHSMCTDFDSTKNEDFICVRCLLKRPISCGSTLVIVPESLLHQWLEEVAKHTNIESLHLMVYWGVSRRYINPLHIIPHDIVLVTYETLRRELDRVHHHEFTRMLRKRKLNAYPPSPLLAINWWRVCLDEAQTVESVNAKAAEMTHKLTAVNRWCVTGTPVQRDLQDLYGLVYFLDYKPHCISKWWHELVWRPYRHGNPQPMIALFSELMWRKSKEDVADELCLPEVKEEIHWLAFSAVEAYFYKKQEELCRNTFLNVVRDLSECMDYVISELHRSVITKLLTPLHTLRQACCHPQLVRKGYVNLNPSKKSYLTMADLLKKLVAQAKQEGREDLRQLVAALNGQAAVYIITKEFKMAVEKYREAMEVWKTHEENFICDRMQRIHTMENLSLLLEEGHSSKSRAISDDYLKEEAAVLRTQYMRTQENQVKAGVQALSIAASTVGKGLEKSYHSHSVFLGEAEDIGSSSSSPAAVHEDDNAEEEGEQQLEEGEEEETKEEDGEEEDGSSDLHLDVPHFSTRDSTKPPSEFWWSSVITWTRETVRDAELFSILETELHSSQDYSRHLTFFDFKELSGLQLALVNQLDKIQTQRTEVLKLVDILSEPGSPSDSLIKAASQCHLKTNRMNPSSPCSYCETECEIKTYEGLLFSRYSIRSEENHKDASRSMSVCERLLRCILSFVKTKRAPNQLYVAGSWLTQYLEALRKEFKHILGLWMKAEQLVRACDELSMAATRLRLLDDSVPRDIEDQFILLENELQPKLLEFSADVNMARTRLQKSHGQLVYLQNLSRTNSSAEDIVSCPICTTELRDEWSVLPCGHCLCMDCLNTLSRKHASHHFINPFQQSPQNRQIHFNCPMCREKVSSNDINYVRSDGVTDDSPLIGSYSTKITAVIGTLKRIKLRDPEAKALVFSSTFEILKLVSHALKENSIEFAFLRNKSDYKTNLQLFKTSPTLNVLLMPMSSGSKGLNITEATHLLLVEPSLNIGAELQAIGRIHRVGQTKETTVHRFYIRNTIEESIKEMLSKSADVSKFIATSNISESDCNLTVAELMKIIS